MAHAKPILEAPRLGFVGTRIAPTPVGDRLMRVAVLLGGFLLAVAPLGGSESVKMSVSPAQSIAPANLFIRMSIEPNSVNRTVQVVAESDDYYRSSEVALEGDQGPKTVFVEFRSVPGGSYEIRGVVADARGHEVAHAHQNVSVLS